MKKIEFYDYLMANSELLYKKYREDTLFKLGRRLDYNKRITFDYKIYCIKNNKKFSSSFVFYDNEKFFLDKLIREDEYNYILDNLDKIIKNYGPIDDDLFKYFKKNSDRITKETYDNIYKYLSIKLLDTIKITEDDINNVTSVLKSCINEDKEIFDIRNYSRGGYSVVYKLNNKIIKIGLKECKKIINNRRILKPDYYNMIRGKLVEVTDYINENSNISYNEIYEVYKELRDQGIVWLDPGARNCKRLTKDYVEKYNKKICNSDYIEENLENNQELKEGDIYIIDLDHLVHEEDLEQIKKIESNLSYETYQTEKNFDNKYKLSLSIKKTI